MAAPDSSSDKTASDPALGRRTFLRHSMVSLGATVQEFVKHRDAPSSEETQKTKVPEKTGWLRPPGAVEEDLFLERCTKCSDCIDAHIEQEHIQRAAEELAAKRMAESGGSSGEASSKKGSLPKGF